MPTRAAHDSTDLRASALARQQHSASARRPLLSSPCSAVAVLRRRVLLEQAPVSGRPHTLPPAAISRRAAPRAEQPTSGHLNAAEMCSCTCRSLCGPLCAFDGTALQAALSRCSDRSSAVREVRLGGTREVVARQNGGRRWWAAMGQAETARDFGVAQRSWRYARSRTRALGRGATTPSCSHVGSGLSAACVQSLAAR